MVEEPPDEMFCMQLLHDTTTCQLDNMPPKSHARYTRRFAADCLDSVHPSQFPAQACQEVPCMRAGKRQGGGQQQLISYTLKP
jgi:hypothetical protein